MPGKRQANTDDTANDTTNEDTGPALVEYIVTATRIPHLTDGQSAPLTFGKKVNLDPDDPETGRLLAAKSITLANPESAEGDVEPNVAQGNTGATGAEPNGAGGDGAPSSVQDSDPNQPQAQHASPEA